MNLKSVLFVFLTVLSVTKLSYAQSNYCVLKADNPFLYPPAMLDVFSINDYYGEDRVEDLIKFDTGIMLDRVMGLSGKEEFFAQFLVDSAMKLEKNKQCDFAFGRSDSCKIFVVDSQTFISYLNAKSGYTGTTKRTEEEYHESLFDHNSQDFRKEQEWASVYVGGRRFLEWTKSYRFADDVIKVLRSRGQCSSTRIIRLPMNTKLKLY